MIRDRLEGAISSEDAEVHDMPIVQVRRGEGIERALRRFREKCSAAGVGGKEKNRNHRGKKRRVNYV